MWHQIMDLAELNFCLARNNWGMEFFMLSVVGFKVAARVQCICISETLETNIMMSMCVATTTLRAFCFQKKLQWLKVDVVHVDVNIYIELRIPH